MVFGFVVRLVTGHLPGIEVLLKSKHSACIGVLYNTFGARLPVGPWDHPPVIESLNDWTSISIFFDVLY